MEQPLLLLDPCTGAIKMVLWRKRQTLDPRPKIPLDHAEFKSTAVPDKFSQKGDGGGALYYLGTGLMTTKPAVNDDCLSGFRADILCNHPVWVCDGTFKSTLDHF